MSAAPELTAARIVALYSAIADEVPLDTVFEALWQRGVRTLAPKVQPGGICLAEVRGSDDWLSGYRGILEPASGIFVETPQVDVFAVPGLLFDRRMFRLGRGGGHYDRLLANAREDALRIGVCYADRVVDGLPTDSWDVPMHLIITENERIV